MKSLESKRFVALLIGIIIFACAYFFTDKMTGTELAIAVNGLILGYTGAETFKPSSTIAP